MKKVVVLGAGKMTEALLEGMALNLKLSNYHIWSPSGKSAAYLASKVGAQHLVTLEGTADFVLLGCKPQQLKDLANSLGGKFKDAVFISMLAAVPESVQRKILGVEKLIRIMPNLAVKYGRGVTLISTDSAKAHLAEIKMSFSGTGEQIVVSEEELEELTILTGSGPALFYEFTKNLAECFSSLDTSTRERLAKRVLSGASAIVESDPAQLQNLIDAVTSKAGVTIAVLDEWQKNGFGEKLMAGVDAGKSRSSQIRVSLQN